MKKWRLLAMSIFSVATIVGMESIQSTKQEIKQTPRKILLVNGDTTFEVPVHIAQLCKLFSVVITGQLGQTLQLLESKLSGKITWELPVGKFSNQTVHLCVNILGYAYDLQQAQAGSDKEQVLRGFSSWFNNEHIEPEAFLQLARLCDYLKVDESLVSQLLYHVWRLTPDSNIILKNPQPSAVLEGHTAPVLSISWSSDGSKLLTGSQDATACIWDTSTGKLLHVLQVGSAVIGVAWTTSGTYAITSSDDHKVMVWDTSTGKRIRTLENQSQIVSSAQNNGLHLFFMYKTYRPNMLGVFYNEHRTRQAIANNEIVKIINFGEHRVSHILDANMGSNRVGAWNGTTEMLATSSKNNTVALWLMPIIGIDKLCLLLALQKAQETCSRIQLGKDNYFYDIFLLLPQEVRKLYKGVVYSKQKTCSVL